MTVFHCGRFPNGEVPIRTRLGLVIFTDGRAEVDDPDLAAAVREQPASFEITEDVEPAAQPVQQPATSGGRPAQSALKADWVTWGVSHGMDPEQADDLTKAQLIELAAQLAEE